MSNYRPDHMICDDYHSYVPDYTPRTPRAYHRPRLTKRQRKAQRQNAMVRDILYAKRKIPEFTHSDGAVYRGRPPVFWKDPRGFAPPQRTERGIPWVRVR